ncbi:MAG: dihydrofolate reductase family protein [Actinomycetota bacterium]
MDHPAWEVHTIPCTSASVLGSGELAVALLRDGLVDALTLSIHPVAMGSGRRLFPGGGPPMAWRLTRSVPTTTGVVIASYEVVTGKA